MLVSTFLFSVDERVFAGLGCEQEQTSDGDKCDISQYG